MIEEGKLKQAEIAGRMTSFSHVLFVLGAQQTKKKITRHYASSFLQLAQRN